MWRCCWSWGEENSKRRARPRRDSHDQKNQDTLPAATNYPDIVSSRLCIFYTHTTVLGYRRWCPNCGNRDRLGSIWCDNYCGTCRIFGLCQTHQFKECQNLWYEGHFHCSAKCCTGCFTSEFHTTFDITLRNIVSWGDTLEVHKYQPAIQTNFDGGQILA